MKQFLKFNYNLKDPTIYKVKNSIKIKDQNNKYILCQTANVQELEEIYQIINQDNLIQIFYEIVKNINGQLYSPYNDKNYVLLLCKKNTTNEISNPIRLKKNIAGNIVKTNWKTLWVTKKDNYSQIIEKNKKTEYDQILYDYYNAMAETAISYIKDKNIMNGRQILTYRILEQKELSNPLNLIVDIEEREIGERLKNKIMTNKISNEEIQKILSKYSENIDLELVYARLLFPNYYYNGLLKSSIDNTKFNILIAEIANYECQLRNIYKKFNEIQNIKKVDWL